MLEFDLRFQGHLSVNVDFEGSVFARHSVKCSGARDRNRTGTPVIHEAADFKSDVSTYFTTRAQSYCETKSRRQIAFANNLSTQIGSIGKKATASEHSTCESPLSGMHLQLIDLDGGATQSRTWLDGFAIRHFLNFTVLIEIPKSL